MRSILDFSQLCSFPVIVLKLLDFIYGLVYVYGLFNQSNTMFPLNKTQQPSRYIEGYLLNLSKDNRSEIIRKV